MIRKLLFILLCCTVGVQAQTRRPMTADDLWKMKRLSSLRVSPDGQYACFTVTEYDVTENKGQSDLWLIHLPTRALRQLTTHTGSDQAPAWHPDSKRIAFVSKREGDYAQLYEIAIDGGEAKLVTDMPMGASSPQYFPDGKKIAFVSTILPEFENDFEGLKKAIKTKKDAKMTAKTTENRFYRYWDHFVTDGYVAHMYSYEFSSKQRTDLTPGWKGVWSATGNVSYDISPDGQSIVVARNATEPPYRELQSDVFLFRIGDFAGAKNLTADNPADDGSPFFSTDGKSVYYQRTTEPDMPDLTQIVQLDLARGDKKVVTSQQPDLSFDDAALSWDGKSLILTTDNRARAVVYRWDGQKISRLAAGGTINSAQIAGERLYYLRSDFSTPFEVAVFDFKTRKEEALTSFNRPLLDSLAFGKIEDVTFKGADGNDVQMFLIYPPNFDATKKYPLLHMIHGGPHGNFGDEFHYRWNAHLFAAPGYVVAAVNFHGSSGFGKTFLQSIVGAHGDKPFTDIMRATDHLIRTYPFIDSTRMAAAGGSYGGYLVNWIAGHTTRFKSLISHAGVYNLMGQFASDMTYQRDKNYGGSPWEGGYTAINTYSPSFFAHHFSTPMLILHGEKDYRVPVTQGLELYGVLAAKGIPARLVYYPNENHWILSPQNSINWYKEVHDWLAKTVK
jgi:dipeptidyl aminopeptidase/acylaminoacyl peptidase